MTTYLCAHHLCSIEQDETRALQAWNQLMHRGLKAYVACRIDAAEIYFCAALDVIEIRARVSGNRHFTDLHWRKPAEFLSSLWQGLGDCHKIHRLIERIAALPSLCSLEALAAFKGNIDPQNVIDASDLKIIKTSQSDGGAHTVH